MDAGKTVVRAGQSWSTTWALPVDSVVNPSPALLHPESTPLSFGEKASFRGALGHVFWEDHVPEGGREDHVHARLESA